MYGTYRDTSHRNPPPFEYCTCRCNVHFDQYSTFSRPYSAHLTNTTHTSTHSSNTHYNKDMAHTTHREVTIGKEHNADFGDVTYANAAMRARDSPVLSEGTDLTNCEGATDSGEYLERLHCSSCDKPLLMYTNLDFKLFDNWVNYVFYHKAFSPSIHSGTSYEQEALNTASGANEGAFEEGGTTFEGKQQTEYVDEGENEYEEGGYAPIAYENENLRSIGDIAGSILMSSEETLFSIINAISPGEQCTSEKNQLFDSVKRFLQYCLGEDTIVHLTGSTAYDIDIDYSEGSSAHCNSDLDIVLLSNAFGGDPRVILQKVYNELSNMQHVLKERNKCPIWVLADSNIKLVETAKVPIVIIETKNGLLCDISVNTLYPLLHTELFKSYIDEHPMVRPLMRIIKHWLLVRGLPTMKEGGFPSILWMSLFCNSLDATMVSAVSNLEFLSSHFGHQASTDNAALSNLENAGSHSADSSDNGTQPSDLAGAAHPRRSTPFNTANYNYAAAAAAGMSLGANSSQTNHSSQQGSAVNHVGSYPHDGGAYDEYEYKEEEEEEEEEYDELNMSETYREMFAGEWPGGCSIGQLWERMQGTRGEYGILCSLEKCFLNLSKGLSVMDIVSRFPHIKSGSDYGGMSLFCKNVIRLIEMEPNVPFGTWLVYYYELNRAKEYMSIFSKRLEILVTLLAFLRLLCNNANSLEDLKTLASGIQYTFGYDLSYLWTGAPASRDYNSLYVNNQYNLNVSVGSEGLAVGVIGINSASTSADSTLSASMGGNVAPEIESEKAADSAGGGVAAAKSGLENASLASIMDAYLANVASLFRIQLRCDDPEVAIKLLIYHMFQHFKSIPNEIFERVQDNVYSIPVSIEPPSPIDEVPDFGHRFECGLWDDSGWYIVVLQERLCVVKVIKICIEWEFWWSKDFVSRRDTRSIFHGFVYRQLRLDLKKQTNYSSFSTFSVNSPSILVKRGSLVLFNPCDIVSKLHVLKVVKHEQYISPSLYSTDFYTGVKCLYVLPGFEVDRFICFEQIAHKLKHYVEFRPHVTYCKLCGIVNMKKINTYTENKIPQRKLRNAKYVLCNQKYNNIYNLMQSRHAK
ncbi:conserved hypothetical protein [Theileria orientalis strain Shintoku]|uniref:Poly(A) RNA polymerase mitochondrial-like central palm domain-containing protein n=1 Tax=Theileria orientalis strain Shintoku TaxID=869250 RepID=J4D5B2_THEOR|nr:conserved hypothetical protein [Theileria orientalis strain Shintoku]BAM38830.1 conserved hypothetical protein [Theileria orientalis strain Shintoku]|eukprot:XP_009689131.1 conserved hypothetical protein [Theileria orientalis strain Shintoku]